MHVDKLLSSQTTKIRERLLDATYVLAVWGRDVLRRAVRPTEIGVRALVVRGDEVLLICHRGGKMPWALPGGGVKKGETLEDATRREVQEEAGCTVRVEGLHGMFSNFQEGFNNHIAVYRCTPLDEPRPPVADLEILTARFASVHDLPATLDKGCRRRVLEYMRNETGLSGEW